MLCVCVCQRSVTVWIHTGGWGGSRDSYHCAHAFLTSFVHKPGSTYITKTLKRYFKLRLFINHVFALVNNTRKYILVTSVGKQ